MNKGMKIATVKNGVNIIPCPKCGGSGIIEDGQRAFSCDYCGGKSVVLEESIITHYTVQI